MLARTAIDENQKVPSEILDISWQAVI